MSAVAAGAALVLVLGCKQPEAPARTAAAGGSPAVAQKSSDRKAFEVKASVSEPVQAGGKSELVLLLAAKGGFHLNADYPANFQPGASNTESQFEQTRYDLKASERVPCAPGSEDLCQLRTRIPFFAAQGEDAQVSGVVSFAICNPDQYLIEKVPVDVKLIAR